MSARVLAGKDCAAVLRAQAAEAAATLAADGDAPRLVVVSATVDAASGWYVRAIAAAAGKVGVACEVVALDAAATATMLTDTLGQLSADPRVHGVALQTPLPGGVRLEQVGWAISPDKDVDGANPLSLGRLAAGLAAFAPATAEAVLALLEHHQVALAGRRAVVVGRSKVVGKPVALLLLDRDATVTICHSRTQDLAAVTATADVVVAAAGRAHLLGPAHVKPGAVVVDVGTNPTADGGVTGDVDPRVAERAGGLTPVPGGVGPVTTAVLLRHTVQAAAMQRQAQVARRGGDAVGGAER